MKPSSKWLCFIILGLIVIVCIWMIAQAPSAFGFNPVDAHPDQGVGVLMAKHIMEGGEFPIFQYDTGYLGSLEAFLLSICYFFFGLNLWVIHIIPVVCFTLFCVALFLLANDLFGSQVGFSLDGHSWKNIFPETNTDPYYWDGPRLYYWELNYRWECRLGPQKARYLLIKNKEQTRRYPWNIGELYVFEDQGRRTVDNFGYKDM